MIKSCFFSLWFTTFTCSNNFWTGHCFLVVYLMRYAWFPLKTHHELRHEATQKNRRRFISSHSEHVNFNDDDSTPFKPIKWCDAFIRVHKWEITNKKMIFSAAASSYKQSLSCWLPLWWSNKSTYLSLLVAS